MSQWQILTDGVADPELFDDGIWVRPGEPGFTTEHVAEEMRKRGADSYSYVGRSTQVHARNEPHVAGRARTVADGMIEHVRRHHREQLLGRRKRIKPDQLEAEVEAEVQRNLPVIEQEARAAVLADMGLNEEGNAA